MGLIQLMLATLAFSFLLSLLSFTMPSCAFADACSCSGAISGLLFQLLLCLWRPQQIQYKVDVPVTCVDDMGAADSIKVFLGNALSCVPLISAIVSMPMSEAPAA